MQFYDQPLEKLWFEHLKEGRMMGLKCLRCGRVEFPPVPICRDCSGTDMEWVQMSGEGELVTFGFSPQGVWPYTDEPVMTGFFELAEGNRFQSMLLDVDDSRQAQLELLNRCPAKVRAEIMKLDDDVSWPVFRLVE